MRMSGTWLILLCAFGFAHAQTNSTVNKMDPIEVTKTRDFELSGDGQAVSWQRTDWYSLPQRSHLENMRETKLKVLYSETGIYFLFYCQDEVLTASKTADFEKLWLEDVVEVFLWPDTGHNLYFEYEISPLNYELPILIPNINGEFLGWRPWQYTGDRKIKHQTKVVGGKKETGAKISGWYAEFFIPYELLRPLSNVPPQAGTTWRANMYRVDHDHQKIAHWSWQETGKSFHEIQKFGPMIFR
ncbi:carbohydrate-binding family 9-like protein [Fulvivirgaceae bacterium BMA12]|uniref:Carbohydrate-binding family 9-like protein n=1 Tax=Agaribacillus aureus TaxID=3051825 RepID=A0ABT8L3F0_9BACT|nr:carbohydrate-binding family 9-like protein [Fulvivirgaceae bacterium BMA12]